MKHPPLVKVIYLEAKPDGSKVDLDEHFASGHTLAELLAHATTTLRRSPEYEHEFAYRETPSALVWLKPTRDGAIPVDLCNFTARILYDVIQGDGAETRRAYEVEARQRGQSVRVTVSAARFAGINWVGEALGAQAILAPGPNIREHTRAAIHCFSLPVAKKHVYTHLGWRNINEH